MRVLNRENIFPLFRVYVDVLDTSYGSFGRARGHAQGGKKITESVAMQPATDRSRPTIEKQNRSFQRSRNAGLINV